MQMDKIKKYLNAPGVGFQIDSRLIKANDVFFALKGDKTDGHLFLQEAAEKKARAAVISKEHKQLKAINLELIRVDDVLSFLQETAAESLKGSQAEKIAVTGSVGKTTTKEYISILLEGEFKVSKTFKNYNSQAGFPIAVLNMNRDADFLVLEMAMDKKKEIEKLVKIAPPDIAVITRLVEYHQHFKSIEELAFAKKEIFCHKNTKIKLINKKLKELKAFKNEEFLTFSINDQKADFYLDIKNGGFYEIGKKMKLVSKPVSKLVSKLVLPFRETHLLEDLTASMAVCRLAGEKYENIFKQFDFLKSEKMRFEKVMINGILFIKDCYNANPASTIAAIKNLPEVKGKKIVVLGSNLELGEFSEEAHEKIIGAAKKNADEILCLGNEWKHIKDIKIFFDHESLAGFLKTIMKKEDVVLIKGSRGMGMEKILDFINS